MGFRQKLAKRVEEMSLCEYQHTWRLGTTVAQNTAYYTEIQSFTHNCCENLLDLADFPDDNLMLANSRAWYRVFSHDVTAAILVSQNNETAAMLVSQTNPVGVELFSYVKTFFCFNTFAWLLAT